MIKRLILFIVRDPLRKIFALIFAFGLWLFVAIDHDYVYERVMPIAYTGLPASLIVTDSLPEIPIEFQGRGRALFMIWATRPKVLCSLVGVRKGDNTIPVRDLFIPLTYTDVIINYFQSAFKVTVDEKTSKTVRLVVPLRGRLREGYAIRGILAPETLTVNGPRALLRNLTAVNTDSVPIDNKDASFIQDLTLQPVTPLITAARGIAPAQIEIDTAVQKLLTAVPLKIQNPFGHRITVDHPIVDTLLIEGPRSIISTITNRDVEIRIRLAELDPGYHSLPAEIIVPNYIKPISSSPKRFGIRVY